MIADLKHKLQGSEAKLKSPDEHSHLRSFAQEIIHEALFAAYQHTAEVDSGDVDSPSGGDDSNGFLDGLQEPGLESRASSQVHFHSGFHGAL